MVVLSGNACFLLSPQSFTWPASIIYGIYSALEAFEFANAGVIVGCHLLAYMVACAICQSIS